MSDEGIGELGETKEEEEGRLRSRTVDEEEPLRESRRLLLPE